MSILTLAHECRKGGGMYVAIETMKVIFHLTVLSNLVQEVMRVLIFL